MEDQFLSPCVTLVSRSIQQGDCEGVLDVNTANRLLSHIQQMLIARGVSSTEFQLSDSGSPRGRVRCGSVVATLSLASAAAAEAVFDSLQKAPLEDIPFGNNNLSFVTTKDAATTTSNPLSMFDFLYWPWRQVDGAEPFIATAAIMVAYASVLALVVLLPIVSFLCCRCCCFTSQCCCPHKRLPLAMRLCSNNLACLLRVAKCCCASNTLSPPETALPVLWRTDADFHAFGKSMYKYRTAAFGDEAGTNESKSSAVVKPEAEAPVGSISTLASGTLAVGTMRSKQSDFESSERKRRRDERRAKRAGKGAQSADNRSLELAVIHPPTEAAWYIGIEIGTRFVTIQFAPDSEEASVAKHAREYGLKLHSAVMHSKASPSGVPLSYWKRLLVADSTRDRVRGTPWVRLFESASSDATATARSIVPEALEAIGAAIAEHNLPAPTSQVAVSLPSYLMHLVTGNEGERIWKWGMLVAGLRVPRVTVCTDTVSAIMTYATSPAAAVHRRSSNLTADGSQQVFFLDVGYGFTSSAGCDIDMDHYRLHMLKEQCIPCACLDIVDNTFRYALQEVERVREAVGLPTLAALAQREGPEVLVQSRERFQKELQSWAEELLAERFRSQSSQTPPQDTRAYLRQRKRLSLMERNPNDVHDDMSKQHTCTSITLTAGEFYKMNREYFQSIIDSVCDTFRACDFRNPPIILVAGNGRPQVPLILSKMSARLKALRREVVAKHAPGAEVGVNQTVCLGDSARGASIIAMLRHQTSETVRHPAAGWATTLRGMRGVLDLPVSSSRSDYTI